MWDMIRSFSIGWVELGCDKLAFACDAIKLVDMRLVQLVRDAIG